MTQDGKADIKLTYRRKQYYIAGPMTGKRQFNFPAFDAAAASLTAAGYLVTSPAELDDEKTRAAAIASPDGDPKVYAAVTGSTWGDFLSRDVKLIADECDAIVALEGWEYSRGARLEIFVARSCGKPVYDYEAWLHDVGRNYLCTDHLIPDDELAEVMEDEVFDEQFAAEDGAEEKTVNFLAYDELPEGREKCENCGGLGERDSERTFEDLPCGRCNKLGHVPKGSQRPGPRGSGEVRVTSETGGQKGKKPQAMGLIPPEALLALSEVYGMGAEKYDAHNYLKGYDWSLSFSACLRHLMAAEKGEWLDEESELPHVMHAAWHCFALFMFERHGIGTDDRISSAVEGVR